MGVGPCRLVVAAVRGVWRVVGALQTGMTIHAMALLQAPGPHTLGKAAFPGDAAPPALPAHCSSAVATPERENCCPPADGSRECCQASVGVSASMKHAH